jgi:hypothetical protein
MRSFETAIRNFAAAEAAIRELAAIGSLDETPDYGSR